MLYPMASAKIISKKEYKRATWKNGLGYTDEIAIHPEGAELRQGNFLWRLSSARIEKASPFSAFPEHDRTLVILKGEGVRLAHRFEEGEVEESAEISPFEPYEFPGDVPSRCELVGGPVTDMSVFVRKAEVEAVTEVVELQQNELFEWNPAGRWNFAIAAEGDFEVCRSAAADARSLTEGDSFRIDLDAPLPEGECVGLRSLRQQGRIILVGLQA